MYYECDLNNENEVDIIVNEIFILSTSQATQSLSIIDPDNILLID